MAQWDRAGLGLTLKHLAQRARNMVVHEIVLSQALVLSPGERGALGNVLEIGPVKALFFLLY